MTSHDLKLRSTSGSLERGSLQPLPLRLWASFSSPPFSLLSDPRLPCSSFPGGDDWASGGVICHVFAQPFAGDEHPPGMPAPSLSFSCARRGTPNPKQFVFGSESGYNTLPTNFDFVSKNLSGVVMKNHPFFREKKGSSDSRWPV